MKMVAAMALAMLMVACVSATKTQNEEEQAEIERAFAAREAEIADDGAVDHEYGWWNSGGGGAPMRQMDQSTNGKPGNDRPIVDGAGPRRC